MQKLDLTKIKEEIEKSSQETAIYIGCDSRRFRKKGLWYAHYTSVVVIHKDSCNGCKVFVEHKIERDYNSIRQRMMNEVYSATNIAYELLEVIGSRPFEIHLDINPNPMYKSSVAVKEALGYVRGMLGVQAKIKPDSPIASNAADLIGKKGKPKQHSFRRLQYWN